MIEKFEKEYYFLTKIDLDTFIEYLYDIRADDNPEENQNQNQNQNKIPEFLNEVDEINYNQFIENKIINNPILSNEFAGKESQKSNFQTIMKNIFDLLKNVMNAYLQLMNRETVDSLEKIYLVVIAFLHCQASNRKKVEVLYNLFSENGQMVYSEKLKTFIILLFSLHSRVYFMTLKDSYSDEVKFSEDEIKKIREWYSIKRINDLADQFLKDFFGGDFNKKNLLKLIRDELERNFASTEKNFLWIFKGKGIRNKLEGFGQS